VKVVLRLIALVALLRVLRVPSGVIDLEDELGGLSWERRSDLMWSLATRGRLPIASRLALGLPALYMMAPLDLLPDFLPFLGHTDDQVAVTTGLQLARIFASKETIAAEMRRLAVIDDGD
jgi:uncharacterized membrane protein YkvA (DUF1232 family)